MQDRRQTIMALDFPSSPEIGEQYVYNTQTYVWSGILWRLVRTSAVGPTGPLGPTGPASTVGGPTGPLGPQGPASTVTGPTGAIGPAGTFTTSPWQNYTPQWTANTTNPTLGNSAVTGRYIAVGSLIIGEIRVTAGTIGFSRGSGTYFLSIPTLAVIDNYQPLGQVVMRDEGPGISYFGTCIFNQSNNSRVEMWMHSQASTFDEGAPAASETPFVFGANDKILVQFQYEAQI
jgi:hypothetical protein